MENPLEPTLDVGQSSFRYQTVQRSFAVAYKMLLAYITAGPNDKELLNAASILATVLPPTDYMTSRKIQKQHYQPLLSKRPSTSIPMSNKRRKG
jgi:predicted class III extradiol MEMO1 family dioxygenase